MNSYFEEVWNGHITPFSDCGAKDPEVEALSLLIKQNEANLEKALNEEQKKLLRNYTACCDEHAYLTHVHAYREGFSLACKLLTEALLVC